MRFRIGINLGDIVEDGDRIYGDGINVAAHVMTLAEGEGTADAYRKGRSRNGWVASMPRLAFEGLEPCDGKLSCPVLRGLGAGNSPRLPGLLKN
jgi:class 3 adenylate cyclase